MSRRWPKGSRRSGTRSTCSSRRARRRFPPARRQPGALDCDGAAASARSSCGGCAPARSGASSRALQPAVVMERYYNFGGEGIMAAGAAGATDGARGQRAGDRSSRGRSRRCIDRALIVEPMRRWRERICARADLIVTPSAAILPAGHAGAEDRASSSGAPTPTGSARARPAPPPFDRPAATVAIFAGAFRSWHGAVNLARAMRELQAAAAPTSAPCSSATDRSCRRVQDEAADLRTSSSPAPCRTPTMPACLAAADIGVAPFEVGAHRPLSLGFYWSPLKIFEYMAAGLPVVAPAIDRIPSLVGHDREGLLYDPAQPGALAPRAGVAGRPAVRARSAAPPASAPSGSTVGRRTARIGRELRRSIDFEASDDLRLLDFMDPAENFDFPT